MRSCCTGPSCGTVYRQRSAIPGCLPGSPQAPVLRPIRQPNKRTAVLRNVGCHASAGSTEREPNYGSFRQDSGSTASTSSVIDVTDQAQKEGKMEEVKQFLKEELHRLFSGGVSFALFCDVDCFCMPESESMLQSVSRERYAADMRFEDPVVNYGSLDGFIFNLQALRTAFEVQFNLLVININGPEEIRTR